MFIKQADYVSLQEEVKQLRGDLESLKASLKRKHDECTHNNEQSKSSRKKLENGTILLTIPEEMAAEGEEFDNNALNMELESTVSKLVSEKITCPNCSQEFTTRQSLRKHCLDRCQKKKMSLVDFNKTFPRSQVRKVTFS
jgi:hypothetical protein